LLWDHAGIVETEQSDKEPGILVGNAFLSFISWVLSDSREHSAFGFMVVLPGLGLTLLSEG
jgi:hypothetical protein